VSIALKQLSAEIDQLGDEFGFAINPDARGQCALEVDDDLIVTLSFSPTSEHYGMHCLLLEAPREFSHDVFVEALRLNAGLAHNGAGTLMYVEEEHALVFGRTGFCTSHVRDTHLREEFLSFWSRARELKQALSTVNGHEYALAGNRTTAWPNESMPLARNW